MMELNEHELNEEKDLLNALEQRNIRAFMRLYKNYNEDLLIYAYGLLNDRRLAIKAVDEFFEDLWIGNQFKEMHPPIYKYLIEQLRGVCQIKYLIR